MLFIISNPTAGAGKSIDKLNQFCQLLTAADLKYEVHSSTTIEECQKLVKKASDKKASGIAIAGGDGTIRAIVKELLASQIPLLILPFGSANDFARKIRQPKEPSELATLWQRKKIKAIDVVRANEQYFLNVAGQGFDVEVLKQAKFFKEKLGNKVSYILGLLVALINLRGHEVTVTIDGQQMYYNNVLLASVGNGTYIGGGMPAHPRAKINDGLLEVCIINDVKIYRIPYILLKFLQGRHLDLPETSYFQAKQVICQTQERMQVELDGEIIEQTPVQYEILKDSLQLIV